VPFHWVRIPSSPPPARRTEVQAICDRHGGEMAWKQIFYTDDDAQAYVLIRTPDDEAKQQAILDELRAFDWIGLVHADDKQAKKRPPKSGKRSEGS